MTDLIWRIGPSGLQSIPMKREEAHALMEIEPILKRLGLSLYCVRCHANGLPDGVRGDNDPRAKTLTVSCGCSVRTYHRP